MGSSHIYNEWKKIQKNIETLVKGEGWLLINDLKRNGDFYGREVIFICGFSRLYGSIRQN